jgi:DNA-binding NtrC family response regulator
MIKPACIALLGDFSEEPVTLGSIGSEFCWSVDAVSDLRGLEDLCRRNDVVAVLLNARTLGMSWEEALKAVQTAAPEARPVVCHSAPEMHRRRDMTDAGAYHTLLLPLDPREVRQSFGFVSDAPRRGPVSIGDRRTAA